MNWFEFICRTVAVAIGLGLPIYYLIKLNKKEYY